ncbi:MAG TPA: iduronate-2-sulfatase, partial [Planctomycetaceae bacterium]|nr:iduronate-2-sulfatase [Planctomycetaceae bacterium]
KVLTALKEAGLEERTIVIFTSDHGYHLGEHDFWAKVSLHDESARVPLIIAVPGKQPAVCHSLTELLDLYPSISKLCGLPVQARLQGKDISGMLDDPSVEVRDAAFSVNGRGFLLRSHRWAYIQYGRDGSRGAELFDMESDPHQYTNLVDSEDHAEVVAEFRSAMDAKMKVVLTNDLGLEY